MAHLSSYAPEKTHSARHPYRFMNQNGFSPMGEQGKQTKVVVFPWEKHQNGLICVHKQPKWFNLRAQNTKLV